MNPLRLSFLAFLVMALMIGMAGTAIADEASGKITNVLADDRVFTFTDKEGVEHTMHLELTGEVRINDRIASFEDLNQGDEVNVTFELRNGTMEASLVECRRE